MPDETSLKKFVTNTLKEIESSLPKDVWVAGNVNFDLSVAIQKGGGGRLSIGVLGADARASKVTTQRISFSVGNKKSADEAVRMMRRTFTEMAKGLKDLDKPKRKRA
jgi:hypothetical protein